MVSVARVGKTSFQANFSWVKQQICLRTRIWGKVIHHHASVIKVPLGKVPYKCNRVPRTLDVFLASGGTKRYFRSVLAYDLQYYIASIE